MLNKEQKTKVSSDFKEQIRPIVDSILSSLFIGENTSRFTQRNQLKLNENDKNEFCKLLKYRYFIKGERIYAKGDRSNNMFFILNGICAATIQIKKPGSGLGFIDAQINTLAAKNMLKVE